MANTYSIRSLVGCTLVMACTIALEAQSVFIPDTNMRIRFNAWAPGSVDSDGYLDTTYPDLSMDGMTVLGINWDNSDLTGIEYFSFYELSVEYSGVTTGLAPQAWPTSIELLRIENAPWSALNLPASLPSLALLNCPAINTLSALPADMQSLYVVGCAISTLPPLPAGLGSLTLRDLDQLASLSALPSSLTTLVLEDLPGITALPPFPSVMQRIELSELPALSSLPSFPATVQQLELFHLPMLGSVPPFPNGLTRLRLDDLPAITDLPPIPASVVDWLKIARAPSLSVVIPDIAVVELDLDSIGAVDLSLLSHYPQYTRLKDLPNVTSLPIAPSTDSIQMFTLHRLPLVSLSTWPVYARDRRLISMPTMTSIPDWDSGEPWGICLQVRLTDMPGITSLPPFPTDYCYGIFLDDCPNLLCLPPIANGAVDMSITGTTPIDCLPNPCANCPPLPICTVLDDCDFLTTAITGRVFWDQDADGNPDAGEPGVPGSSVWSSPGSFGAGLDSLGNYSLWPVPGTYTVYAQATNPYITAINPGSHGANIPTITSVDSLNHFAVQAPVGAQDLRVDMGPVAAVPGFTRAVVITCNNDGTLPMTASVTLTWGPVWSWSGSSIAPDVLEADHATWTFANMDWGAVEQVTAYLHVDSTTAIGIPAPLQVVVDPLPGDLTTPNNTVAYNDSTVAAFDPNDKQVYPTRRSPEEVAAAEELLYTIRFQNTGTYPASRVVITDTLSADLQWNTMRLVSSSHACEWFINSGVLHFVYDPIYLPDSTSDEPNSHGFVKFAMKPVNTLMLGESVGNTANIYFDFNAPVITNEAVFTVESSTSIDLLGVAGRGGMEVWPNPVADVLRIVSDMRGSLEVLDVSGRAVLRDRMAGASHLLDVRTLAPGRYTLRIAGGVARPFIKR